MSQLTIDNESIARMVPEDIATNRNFDLFDEIFTEDSVQHGQFGQKIQGRDALRALMEGYVTAFPDLEARVKTCVTEGDTVAMRVVLSGTHEGEFMGIAPTNESFMVENSVFTRLEDGKIAERWILPDTFGMFQQLGLVDAPKGFDL